MIQNTFCTQLGHQQFQVSHFCTYKWCYMNRGCCSECINDNIHGHQMWSQNHIMTFEAILERVVQVGDEQQEYFKIQYAKESKNFFEQVLMEYKNLENLIFAFRQTVEGQMNNLVSVDEHLQQSQPNQCKKSFFKQDDKINELLNVQCQFDQNNKLQIQDLDSIQQQLTKILLNLKRFEENMNDDDQKNKNKNNKKNKNKDIKSRKYVIQKIAGSKKLIIDSSIISKNEKYLVYNSNYFIRLYNIKLNKFFKSTEQQNRLSIFQFTSDSTLLFAGDFQGFVLGFVVNGLKLFYKQQIHQDTITQIIIQNQYLITSSRDETLIKTNFFNKQQIFKIFGYSEEIFSIDYDESKNMLISAQDQFIKIWDCENKRLIIDQEILVEESQYFFQVQLDDNKNLLALDNQANLWKWKIDYQNKQLIELAQYNDNSRIFGFQQVDHQNILLIFEQYCKILNSEGEVINVILHNTRLYSNQAFKLVNRTWNSYRKQIDSLNYIILQDEFQIYLLRVQP